MFRNAFFESCIGAEMGSTIYESTFRGHPSKFDCLCDVNCGNEDQSQTTSVYAFDESSSINRDINSTNSISQNYYGTIHILRFFRNA